MIPSGEFYFFLAFLGREMAQPEYYSVIGSYSAANSPIAPFDMLCELRHRVLFPFKLYRYSNSKSNLDHLPPSNQSLGLHSAHKTDLLFLSILTLFYDTQNKASSYGFDAILHIPPLVTHIKMRDENFRDKRFSGLQESTRAHYLRLSG